MTYHLPEQPHLQNISVILVEPGESMNIGSVARAMGNLGYADLRLADPQRYNQKRAEMTACNGHPVLTSARHYPNYHEAIAECNHLVGFTTRTGKYRSNHMMFDEWLATLTLPLDKIGLVFGPEDNGLREEHCEECRYLVRIPSTEHASSYNLAQSALLAIYLLRIKLDQLAPKYIPVDKPPKELPNMGQYHHLDLLAQEIGVKVDFLHQGTPHPMVSTLKAMLRRIEPDEREMRVLLALFRRVLKSVGGTGE